MQMAVFRGLFIRAELGGIPQGQNQVLEMDFRYSVFCRPHVTMFEAHNDNAHRRRFGRSQNSKS